MKQLTYRALTEEDKRQICAWRYDGEYALYDLPDYAEMQARRRYRTCTGSVGNG